VVRFSVFERNQVAVVPRAVDSPSQPKVIIKPSEPLNNVPVDISQPDPLFTGKLQTEMARFDSIISKWRSERGYAVLLGNGQGEVHIYESYDIETLQRLADSGDGFAVNALARASVLKGLDAMVSVYKKAAVRGSTEALYLAGITSSAYTERLPSSDERRAGIIDALTWYNVAALRGDRSPNLEGSGSLLRQLDVPLSGQDKEFIKLRSQEIYDDLQQQRTAQGLGDFDNSVPPEVKAYYDDIEANVHGLYKR
jgi:hypothetical protein